MKKQYHHNKVVLKISEELGIPPQVVGIIIKKFFLGMRKLMFRNEEINIKGFFMLKLTTQAKNKLKKFGKNYKLYKRVDRKTTAKRKRRDKLKN